MALSTSAKALKVNAARAAIVGGELLTGGPVYANAVWQSDAGPAAYVIPPGIAGATWLGFSSAKLWDINGGGSVVGVNVAANGITWTACRWNPPYGAPINISGGLGGGGFLGGGGGTIATGIEDGGAVVMIRYWLNAGVRTVDVYKAGVLIAALRSLTTVDPWAFPRINLAGELCGTIVNEASATPYEPYFYDGAKHTITGPTANVVYAVDIDDFGTVLVINCTTGVISTWTLAGGSVIVTNVATSPTDQPRTGGMNNAGDIVYARGTFAGGEWTMSDGEQIANPSGLPGGTNQPLTGFSCFDINNAGVVCGRRTDGPGVYVPF